MQRNNPPTTNKPQPLNEGVIKGEIKSGVIKNQNPAPKPPAPTQRPNG